MWLKTFSSFKKNNQKGTILEAYFLKKLESGPRTKIGPIESLCNKILFCNERSGGGGDYIPCIGRPSVAAGN